jgi:hypothetical protein
MEEIWKELPSYEGIYEVSNLGNIKSLSRIKFNKGKFPFICKEKILKLGKDTNGYYSVSLYKNGKIKTSNPHRLMAIAFLGHKPCGLKLVVDHINNNPLDNRLENLQIITNRENASKDRKNGTSKYTGVSWDKERNKWTVRFKINGKNLFLGYFLNEEEASEVYNNKLKELI